MADITKPERTAARPTHRQPAQDLWEHFAKGRRKDMMLKTLLAETGTDSVHGYLRKHHK